MSQIRLFIAEKPELAKAICEGLGGGFTSRGGYYQKGDDIVVNCFGHMLQLCNPEDYDPSYEKWNLEQLPFHFLPVKKKPKPDTEDRLNLIISLIEKADIIVNAGDDDEEGQLLIDEILRYVDNKKPVLRVIINAVTPKGVVKALSEMKPNSEFEYMGWRAEARSIADQIFGYNFSRLFTVLSRNVGGQGVISVGRVQTPLLGLIVRRDKINSSHVKAYYYNVSGGFSFADYPNFQARYILQDDDPISDNGRLESKEFADLLVEKSKGKVAVIASSETKEKKKSPPLPYNLNTLQQDCSRKWGYSLEETGKIADALRLNHGLVTYSRSDSRYLNDEHFEEAPTVLQAVAQTSSELAGLVAKADTSIKSKAFNPSKVTAHHGIIPTETVGDLSKLTEAEKNVYLLIAKQFIAQFYPSYTYDETTIIVEVCDKNGSEVVKSGLQFGGKSKVDKELGWKPLYSNDKDNDEVKDDADVDSLDLRDLKQGTEGTCIACEVAQKETKPPALYTDATLVAAMSRVANEVKDPNLAKILKEKDKDKADENGGIGTSATRDKIIAKLFERNFIVQSGDKVISTDLGKDFYDLLPDLLKYPDMTAIWFEQQKGIQTEADVHQFIETMMKQVIVPLVTRLKTAKIKVTTYDCPKCGRFMRRMPSKEGGFWWGCSGYDDEENPCKHGMNDLEGKPVERTPKPKKGRKGFGLRV